MQPKLDPAVEAAIDWSVKLRFNQADAEVWARFQRWRAEDAAHDAAWRRMEALHADFAGHAPAGITADTLSLLHGRRRTGRRRALKFLMGAGVVTGSSWLIHGFTPWQRVMADYSTAYGERRTWTLDDGTRVVLNTDSAIAVNFSASERRIELLRGEIQVTTGADAGAAAKRALRVATAFGDLSPIGTVFLVRLRQHNVQMTVQQGAVALSPRAARQADTAQTRIARAGETWTLQAEHAYREARAGGTAGAWVNGSLVAEDMPLAELLSELGRYRAWHLRWDPAVAAMRITAVIQLDDLDRALDFLAQSHGLLVQRYTPFYVTVGKRPTA